MDLGWGQGTNGVFTKLMDSEHTRRNRRSSFASRVPVLLHRRPVSSRFVPTAWASGLLRQNYTFYNADDKCSIVGRELRVEHTDRPIDDAPVKVRADDFAREFETDQVKANDRYSGRMVEITGLVKGVVNSAAHPQITLIGGNADTTTPRLSFGSRHKGSLESVKKGQAITIRGICTGDAHLHHCSLPGQPDDPPRRVRGRQWSRGEPPKAGRQLPSQQNDGD